MPQYGSFPDGQSQTASIPQVKTRQATVLAHAKLNLSLRVLYKRPDNFHELRTVFQTISLADELTISFTPAKQTEVEIADNAIPDNLIERAARRCLDEMRVAARVHVILKKRIPMGAGLGGGSSDAAAVLLALPALAGKYIPIDRLSEIGASLGSDVPFFLYGGTALGLGKGEELYPLPDSRPRHGVLLAPDIHVSTPDAYRGLSAVLGDPTPKLAAFQRGCWQPEGFESVNDFEAPVFQLYPRLATLKKSLIRKGAEVALMTGSGSSIFAFFNTKETVRHVVQSMEEVRVYPIRILSGRSYRREWLRRLQPHIEGNLTNNLWPPRSRYVR
jgi:4-diphosphocytidyl-2-C-methyl-D-erythritol kinase